MPDDDARIDPRYDPAFQRGFDGEVVSGQRGRSAGVLRSAVTAPAPYRTPIDAVPDGDEPVGLSEAPVTRATRLSTTGGADGAADDGYDADDDAIYRHRGARGLLRNPFVIALMALDAALLISGVAWFAGSRALVSGNVTSELDYWLLQTSVVGAPIVVAAGALVLAGLLALFARAWQRG